MHMSVCSERHSAPAGEEETRGLGRRAQDPGRGTRWTEGPYWYHRSYRAAWAYGSIKLEPLLQNNCRSLSCQPQVVSYSESLLKPIAQTFSSLLLMDCHVHAHEQKLYATKWFLATAMGQSCKLNYL